MPDAPLITVEADVRAPVQTVWDCWTQPEHITQWNHASDDWHSPHATVDLREGGNMVARMEAKDGSAGFDFGTTFTKVVPHAQLDSVMDDGRTISVLFSEKDGVTRVTETFMAEGSNPVEMQRAGWQSILDNFARYAEAKAGA